MPEPEPIEELSDDDLSEEEEGEGEENTEVLVSFDKKVRNRSVVLGLIFFSFTQRAKYAKKLRRAIHYPQDNSPLFSLSRSYPSSSPATLYHVRPHSKRNLLIFSRFWQRRRHHSALPVDVFPDSILRCCFPSVFHQELELLYCSRHSTSLDDPTSL